MNLLVVVQARMGSTRLPKKVLLPAAGRPLLQRLLERIASASTNFDVVVATTVDPMDDPIRSLCKTEGYDCYSGHPNDLLDRHYRAAVERKADAVVKIPSDCPLIDPGVIDRVLGYFLEHHREYDYVSNLHPPSYPDGNDVEVMTLDALGKARREATRTFEREHATPYIWNTPGLFRIGNVRWESGLDFSRTHRWTLDYEEDYRFIARVFEELWTPKKPLFSMRNVFELLAAHPEIHDINAVHAGTGWYHNHANELIESRIF